MTTKLRHVVSSSLAEGSETGAFDDAQKTHDLSQLQREYRHMELNRRAYADESAQMLRKQNATIEKLRRENDALKTSLAMEFRQFKKPADASLTDKLSKLQDQADWYTQHIEAEKAGAKVMAEQVALMRQRVLHQRKSMGGVNAARENEQMVQKQVRILENRLDKALTKFNEALSHNKSLRQEIDDLRRERVVFDGIYRKLEKDLTDKKQKMAAIIELSNLAYEQRDNSQMEIAAIEQANRREQNEFSNQMLELSRVLESELHASGSTTAHSRSQQQQQLHGSSSSASVSASGTGTAAAADADGAEGTRSLNKGAWSMAKDKVDLQVSIERIQNFEEAFNRIKAATGVNDIEELVRTFIKNEDQNFSLFNYVNEQQNEIEKLEEQLQVLRAEQAKYAQESGEDVNQHKTVLKDLEARLHATEAAAEKYEVKTSEAAITLDQLRAAIASLSAHAFGLDTLPQGFSDGRVTESNMMAYLGLIESRTNDLLRAYAAARDCEKAAAAAAAAASGEEADGDTPLGASGSYSGATSAVLGSGPQVPMGQELLHVTPPKLDDYSTDGEGNGNSDNDDSSRPLTHEELKARTLTNLQRKATKEAHRAAAKRAPKK